MMDPMDDGDQPQGDFDGSGNASWGEADWSGYLQRNDLEVGRFLAYYNEVKNLPDRLDISARRMGWENADWAPGDGPGRSTTTRTKDPTSLIASTSTRSTSWPAPCRCS